MFNLILQLVKPIENMKPSITAPSNMMFPGSLNLTDQDSLPGKAVRKVPAVYLEAPTK